MSDTYLLSKQLLPEFEIESAKTLRFSQPCQMTMARSSLTRSP